jgi:hypothetical protein
LEAYLCETASAKASQILAKKTSVAECEVKYMQFRTSSLALLSSSVSEANCSGIVQLQGFHHV